MVGRRRLSPLAAIAAIGAIAAVAASCSNPASFLKSVNNEVKSSLKMYLVVSGVSPEKDSTSVNPSSQIKIDFDRSLDASTIVAANVSVAPASAAGSPVDSTYSYSDAQRRLTVTPASLEGGVEYIVTIGAGLRSSAGEPLEKSYAWSFTTAALPGGTITINGGAAYVNATEAGDNLSLGFNVNGLVDKYFYVETTSPTIPPVFSDPLSHAWDALPSGNPKLQSVPPLTSGEGAHYVYYQFRSAATPSYSYSSVLSASIILDTQAPATPTAPVISSTATHTPTWTWSSGVGGNGTYRYELYSFGAGSYIVPWTETTSASYTSPGVADGGYRIYVTERDDAGNWSVTPAYSSIAIIDAPPNAPIVTRVASVTLDTTPTWSWSSGGFGNGTFQYQLDSTSGSWTSTTDTSYTPSSALSDGLHYLYVEESDGAEWSSYGYASIRTTPVIPYEGSRSSSLPALSWRGIKGGTYTIQLYRGESWVNVVTGLTTNSYQVPKSAPLPVGTVTWRVVRVPVLGITTYLPSSSGGTFLVMR
jgi:hypothetical protein